jgi:hypothetical protein
LNGGNHERSGKFAGVVLDQADPRIQHLDDARERTQDQ